MDIQVRLVLGFALAIGAGVFAAHMGLNGQVLFGLILVLGLIGLAIAVLIAREPEEAETKAGATQPPDDSQRPAPARAPPASARSFR
jgi:hypothetical protein